MSFNCEFCNNSLHTANSLEYHKKNNKKCLQIQNNGEISGLLSCEYCSKQFSKGNLKAHLNTCKEKKKSEYDNLMSLFEKNQNEVILLKQQIEFQKKEAEIEINSLKKEIEFYKHYFEKKDDVVNEIAKEPKTRNTTNSNKISFNNTNVFKMFNEPDKVKELIEKYLSTDHIIDGQKGVAEFTLNYLIGKDADGNLNYICTDTSRGIFKYLKENGEIGKDTDADQLTKLLLLGELKKQSLKKAEEIWTNEDGSHNSDMYQLHSLNAQEIIDIERDNSQFRKCLAKLTSK
jgi:hypothetical protein